MLVHGLRNLVGVLSVVPGRPRIVAIGRRIVAKNWARLIVARAHARARWDPFSVLIAVPWNGRNLPWLTLRDIGTVVIGVILLVR